MFTRWKLRHVFPRKSSEGQHIDLPCTAIDLSGVPATCLPAPDLRQLVAVTCDLQSSEKGEKGQQLHQYLRLRGNSAVPLKKLPFTDQISLLWSGCLQIHREKNVYIVHEAPFISIVACMLRVCVAACSRCAIFLSIWVIFGVGGVYLYVVVCRNALGVVTLFGYQCLVMSGFWNIGNVLGKVWLSG